MTTTQLQPGSGTKPDTGKKAPRSVPLDFLRGVAILLVLGHHAILSPRQSGLWKVPATLWQRLGWTGVDLFFVLSGFLIGGLLFQELRTQGRIDVRRFIIRRGLKIWPSYYVFIFGGLALSAAMRQGSLRENFLAIVPNLLHIQNYLQFPHYVYGHTWSLAVEEHFYLLLPLALLLLQKVRRAGSRDAATALPYFPILALTVMAACLIYRCIAGRAGYVESRVYLPTHARMDSLFCGVLLAYGYHYHRRVFQQATRYRRFLLPAGIMLLLPFAVLERAEHALVWTIGFTMLYVGYGCILVALMTSPEDSARLKRFFASRFARGLAWVGTFSYPIYLWHLSVGYFPLRLWAAHGLLNGLAPTGRWAAVMAIYVVWVSAFGIFMAKLIEIPVLRLRDRLFPASALNLSAPNPDARNLAAAGDVGFPSGLPPAVRETAPLAVEATQ